MKKLSIIILLLGFLVSGCGTENKVANDEPVNGTGGGGHGIVAGEVAASLTRQSPLVFQYEVKNQTEQEVTLEFTSSQRYDYSVKNKDGEEIFLFSSTAAFLQALGEVKIKQGETLSYVIDLKRLSLEKGDYTLTVWMTPTGGPKYKAEQEFSVE
ncbi:BsuPI-related putative proteinase inhibitor [Heyndrickxia sp. MSNUG]|uniref:BsuPI-related putative proteinase inhibitor n=1 Tax=Heyndrickxia sp. MSNUG TaxID=3136677 RepID=UPI003C2B0992